MVFRQKRLRRDGVTLVEFGAVVSVTMVIIFILIVGGAGVFRYQEVAHLAREGARYASTHGGQYNADGHSGQIISSSDMLTYLSDRTTLLDPSQLSVTIDWVLDSDPTGSIASAQKA